MNFGEYKAQEEAMKLEAEKDPKKYVLLIVLIGVFIYLVM